MGSEVILFLSFFFADHIKTYKLGPRERCSAPVGDMALHTLYKTLLLPVKGMQDNRTGNRNDSLVCYL